MAVDVFAEQAPTPQPIFGIRLFKRVVIVRVSLPGQEGREWKDLRVNFSVEKSDKGKPNKSKIQLYGLSRDSRGFIQEEGARIVLQAGYDQSPPVIFQGDVDDAEPKYDGRDIVMNIEGRDGGTAYNEAAIFETYEAPLTYSTLLNRVAQSMGLRFANLPANLPDGDLVQGYSMAGPAREVLDEITSTLGAQWSIQDGELVVTLLGEGTAEEAWFLSPTTGLINSPQRDKKGVKLRVLMNGRIKPGRKIVISSRDVQGVYIPTVVKHQGDSGWSDDFYTEIEARAAK